ncbi:MAG: endonuclease/exonuclease/phosphatase family protein, partial [Planctomycetota bacterium]|nr:endonuclease/exonuclease/phosphatase family protein [Planctomycetota bacterium]
MLSLLLPTLALCMAQAPQVSQEPPAIRMLSWNIENFFDRWDDPYRRDQITKPAYASDARMERVAKVLQAFDADVVALQE